MVVTRWGTIEKMTLDELVICVGVSKLGFQDNFVLTVNVTLFWNEEDQS